MRKYLFLIVLVVGAVTGYGQVQEMEQLKLNLEKLVQLKLMLSKMKQGYQTLQNGYNSVRDAAKGNFNLHKNHLDGLLQVNSKVANSPVVREIGIDADNVRVEFDKAWRMFSGSGVFRADELTVFRGSWEVANGKVSDAMGVLSSVLTPGALRMNDEERLAATVAVREEVSKQLMAVRSLISDYSRVMAIRMQQKKDNNALKKLKGIQ